MTLQQLWQLVSVVEIALLAVSICVVAAGLIGMLTAILTSLNERRREMAILRAVGARPWHVLLLMVSESALLAVCGVLAGMAHGLRRDGGRGPGPRAPLRHLC